MQTVHSFRAITYTLALAAALILGGCNLFEDDAATIEGESGLTSPWVGRSMDSLAGASALEFHSGRLFVANRDAASPGVAAIDTATGTIAEYYPEIVSPTSMAITAGGDLVVSETDYTQGSVSVINPSAKKIRKSVIVFGSDNAAAAADGKVYLFDRTSGAVTGFTGNTPGTNVKFDVQAGAGSNPYGIAVANNKAYVVRYNMASLLIFNSADQIGGGTRDSINLLAWSKDTVKNVPYMAQAAASGDYVFVTLQRWIAVYPRVAALDTALVLVINANTKTVEAAIPLHFRNPTSARVVDDIWYISCLGEYGIQDGGVEKINLATRQHAGTVITEAALGGDVGDYVPTPNGGYATYSTNSFVTTKVKKVAP